jgi:hypothetical protein
VGDDVKRRPADFQCNMVNQSADLRMESRQQKFERVLSREPFKGLKAIFDGLSSNRQALFEGVEGANSYEEFLAKVGYRMILTKQIHVQDCYSRLGPAGGIKAVLPYHDVPTQSSLPTLVNFDSTVTTTPKSAGFFNKMLAALKTQLNALKPATSGQAGGLR